MGGNFKFQVEDSFLEFFFFEILRFEKRITLFEKKTPLVASNLVTFLLEATLFFDKSSQFC